MGRHRSDATFESSSEKKTVEQILAEQEQQSLQRLPRQLRRRLHTDRLAVVSPS